jgi:hypothetical protein
MTQAEFLRDAAPVVVQAAFWSALAFTAWYSICAPWWRYSVGRAIVALDSAIALACLPTVLGLLFGAHLVASPFFSWLTVAAFAAIPVITTYRGVIVWRIQRRAAALKAGEDADAG